MPSSCSITSEPKARTRFTTTTSHSGGGQGLDEAVVPVVAWHSAQGSLLVGRRQTASHKESLGHLGAPVAARKGQRRRPTPHPRALGAPRNLLQMRNEE